VPPRRPNATAAPPAPIDLNPRSDPPLDFPDGDLGDLSPEDYTDLGFMCGLEVHQQLMTRRKLFCRCPAGRRTEKVDAVVLRHMRPTLSEMGYYDGCALMEYKTRKEIVYLLERESVCTYEIDDTPPFEIDPEAVRHALEISTHLGLNLVSELQVMRKQYLDGSIPTGFQRSAVVGIGGVLPFRHSELGPGRQIRVRQLTIEEDSCREVSDVGHRITFRTDRLGTPLIETVTEPDLLTPMDVETGSKLLAQVARIGHRIRRGAGTARQDVNVSIAGSRRIELKGVGSQRLLPRLVHVEAFRQLNLLRIRDELLRRGITAESLDPGQGALPWDSGMAIDATKLVRLCAYAPIEAAVAQAHRVCAVKLSGFADVLRHRTQPGVVFGDELADRVRVIACLTARPFMIDSDRHRGDLPGGVWNKIRKSLHARPEDAIVVLWGTLEDLLTAIWELLDRAREALKGVPSETRQPFPDGTTGFERILPGPERMYPDTDTPPLPIPDAWVASVASGDGLQPWEREERLRAWGLPDARICRLMESPWLDLFDELCPREPGTARRLASACEKRLPMHRRRSGLRSTPTAARLRPLVEALDDGAVRPEATEIIFDRLILEPSRSAAEIVGAFAIDGAEESGLKEMVDQVARRRSEVLSREPDSVLRWAMGQVMPTLVGRMDPRRVREVLRDALSSALALEDSP